MADTETTEAAAPADTAEWRQRIEHAIAELRDMLRGSGTERGSEGEPDQPASISAEVRRELQKLRADEARVQRESERDAEVADLKEKVNAERPPREYRRATKVMRWDTEADR